VRRGELGRSSIQEGNEIGGSAPQFVLVEDLGEKRKTGAAGEKSQIRGNLHICKRGEDYSYG
jgi:hypothetical protein